MKREKKIAIIIISFICILLSLATISKAEVQGLESKKYLILEERGIIARIIPETSLAELRQNFNIPEEAIHIYQDETLEQEVTEGYIGTGMVLKYDGSEEEYTLSVIGDFNKDGLMNQIELNHLIKHVIGLQNHQIEEELTKKSADITGDNKLDQIDITTFIRYIAFHELYIPEIKRPEAPTIEVIRGVEGENNWYTTDVEVKIIENASEVEIGKTIYKITGSKQQEETEIEKEAKVNLEEGEYKITSYSYSKEGARSTITSKTIKIDKTAPTVEIAAEVKINTIKVRANAEDKLSGIQNYIYYIGEKNEAGEIIWQEGIASNEQAHEFTNLKKGTEYYIKVEVKDNAGNIGTSSEEKHTTENIDETKPTGDIRTIPTQNTINVKVDAKDEESGIKEYIYYIGKENESGEIIWEEGIVSPDPTHKYEDLDQNTEYKVKVEIVDNAGNKAEIIKTVTTMENGAMGTYVSITQNTSKWTNKEVIATVRSHTEEYETEYSIDGITWEGFTEEKEITINENGTIFARAKDNEEVLEIVSLSIANIDKEAPKVKITPKDITSKSFKATLEAEDQISGIAKLTWYYKLEVEETYREETSNYVVIGSTGKGKTEQIKEYEYKDLKGGTYWVCAEITDAAGNKTLTDTIYVETLEITPGKDGVEITQNNTNWTNENIEVNIETKDERYDIKTSKDGENWTDNKTYIIEENGSIYVKLTDGINDGETYEYKVTNIDKTKAEAEINEKEVTSKSFTVEADITDNASGLGQIKWYYKNETADTYIEIVQDYKALKGAEAGELEAVKELTIDNLPKGKYKVYAKVYDVAGNETITNELTIELETITAGNDALEFTPSTENWTNERSNNNSNK